METEQAPKFGPGDIVEWVDSVGRQRVGIIKEQAEPMIYLMTDCITLVTERDLALVRAAARPDSYHVRHRQFVLELSKGFDDAMGRLEDLMMRDDGQAYSETERVMPRLRELRRAVLHINHEFRQ